MPGSEDKLGVEHDPAKREHLRPAADGCCQEEQDGGDEVFAGMVPEVAFAAPVFEGVLPF